MTDPTAPQGPGPMTLEQGVALFKAKAAKTGTTIEDAVVVHPDDPNETPEDQTEGEAALEENTEAVSEDASETVTEPERDDRPVLLPDGSEITVEEARKGYLRQADWTRKTQDLARARETVEAEKQNGMKQIAELHQSLTQLQETEPNWLQLAQDPNTDPKQLQAAQAYWQQKKNTMAAAQQQIRETEARRLQSQKAAAYQALNEGRFDPTWKDPKVLKTALDTVSDYLIDRGLPPDVLGGITNPLFIEIAEESRRYRAAMANKPKTTLAVKGKPAPVKPGAKSTASPQSENIRLLNEQFQKNPNVDNAVLLEKAKAGLR